MYDGPPGRDRAWSWVSVDSSWSQFGGALFAFVAYPRETILFLTGCARGLRGDIPA